MGKQAWWGGIQGSKYLNQLLPSAKMIRKPGAKGSRKVLFTEASLPVSEQVENGRKQIWRGIRRIPMTQT